MRNSLLAPILLVLLSGALGTLCIWLTARLALIEYDKTGTIDIRPEFAFLSVALMTGATIGMLELLKLTKRWRR